MNIAPYIDHTLLKPDTTFKQIKQLCLEAIEHKFTSVCVAPYWIDKCREIIAGTKVKVCTVIGFPLGANFPEVKSYEAMIAVGRGAAEIDMVINIGALKSGLVHLVEMDVANVREIIPKAILKVIIETCLLTDTEKALACQIAKKAKADFVKTSTGFSTGGATIEDIKLMRKIIGPKMGIKASGGIKDFKTAKAMIEAGANRLGCSASVAIVEEAKKLQVH